jgi:hypothetical protein
MFKYFVIYKVAECSFTLREKLQHVSSRWFKNWKGQKYIVLLSLTIISNKGLPLLYRSWWKQEHFWRSRATLGEDGVLGQITRGQWQMKYCGSPPLLPDPWPWIVMSALITITTTFQVSGPLLASEISGWVHKGSTVIPR